MSTNRDALCCIPHGTDLLTSSTLSVLQFMSSGMINGFSELSSSFINLQSSSPLYTTNDAFFSLSGEASVFISVSL